MKRVLIVDDEPVVRALVQASLSDCDVAACADGESALRHLEQRRADLVLLDLGLPGMSGAEVARRLRGNGATAAIPIVYLTGHDASRSGGADGVVQKPFTPASLRRDLRAWLA